VDQDKYKLDVIVKSDEFVRLFSRELIKINNKSITMNTPTIEHTHKVQYVLFIISSFFSNQRVLPVSKKNTQETHTPTMTMTHSYDL